MLVLCNGKVAKVCVERGGEGERGGGRERGERRKEGEREEKRGRSEFHTYCS